MFIYSKIQYFFMTDGYTLIKVHRRMNQTNTEDGINNTRCMQTKMALISSYIHYGLVDMTRALAL